MKSLILLRITLLVILKPNTKFYFKVKLINEAEITK